MQVDIRQGDCRELFSTVPDGSIDIVLSDPPFGTTKNHWDVIIPFDFLWKEITRVLNPNGVVVLFGCQPFTSEMIQSNRKWFRQCLVWDKNKCGSPGLAKIRPMQVHEDIVVFSPGKYTYNPQMTVGEPYSRNPPKQVRCNNHQYGFTNDRRIVNTGTRYPTSIIRYSRDFSAQQQVHPTQKPVGLMEWLLKTYSNERDTALDFCFGSGTAGVAAINTNRNYIGFELPESEGGYFNLGKSRIEDAQYKKESRLDNME